MRKIAFDVEGSEHPALGYDLTLLHPPPRA